MTAPPPRNVLFLCTGNSARSIMAESILAHKGGDRFRAFSAGSFPRGEVHPLALQLLQQLGLPVDGLHPKSWNTLAEPGAPVMDFIFTVCDGAAGEVCPIWPGQPMTAHWGVPDPAQAQGNAAEQMLAFRDAFRRLERRIDLFLSIRHLEVKRAELKEQLDAIGRLPLDQAEAVT